MPITVKPYYAPAGAFMLHVLRGDAQEDRTIGQLYVDGSFQWWTLENTLRPLSLKIQDRTAIPAGTYRVVLSMSRRFGVVLPEILAVPGFSGIRIHPGNTPADTSGCILVGGGYNKATNTLIHSQEACRAVQGVIAYAIADGKQVWIEVVNPASWKG